MAFERQPRASAGSRALAFGALTVAVLHGLRGLFHPQELGPSDVVGQAFAMYAKRPKNAYMFFAAEKRADFAEEGKSVREVAKELGEAWRKLTKTGKKKYESAAAKDRKRFEEELEQGLEVKPRKTKGTPETGKEKKAGPKRPKNAYMFFAADMRPKYAKKGVSVTEVAKALGAEWKTLKAPARKKYEAEAAKDKERYQEELAAMG